MAYINGKKVLTAIKTVMAPASLQEKRITPTNFEREVVADSGYDALSKVKISGVLVDTHQTLESTQDGSVAYIKTVPAGALPYASIDTLGGMSYKYNQLCDLAYDTSFGHTYTINGMDITVYDGYILCNGTTTDNIGIVKSANIIANHKYINKGGKSNAFGRYDFYDPEIINLETALVDNDSYAITILSGTTYNNKKIPIYVVDLTAMYGVGNEPTTVEQFLADYPMYNDYVPYTEGDITNASVTSIDSIGVNIWDEEWEVGSISLSTGKNEAYNDYYRSKNYTKIIPNERYYFSFIKSDYFYVFYYDIDKNLIRYEEFGNRRVLNIPTNTYFIKILGTESNNYENGITISLYREGERDYDQYYPYTHNNYPIPSSIQSLDGYGWGINDSLYNYIDFERKKFVKRVGRVDLGTLNWFYYTGDGDNIFYISNENIPSNFKQSGQIICNKYETRQTANVAPNFAEKVLVGWDTYHNQNLVVKDSTYTDATTFKTAMSGVYLYYELATPVEIDLSDILTDDNFIEVEANGTITFENTNKNAVPSKIAYLVEVK